MSIHSDRRSVSSTKSKDQDLPLPPAINVMQNRYPFCIVWAPIPLVSWIFPFIGHVGICDSEGKAYDFQGDFQIGTDQMLFGYPVKYWDLSHIYVPSFYNSPKDSNQFNKIQDEIDAYNAGIGLAKGHFTRIEHYNFFTNNCHSFVAACLNKQTVRTRKENMFTVCLGMLLHAKYTSVSACLAVFAPLIILTVLVVFLIVVHYNV